MTDRINGVRHRDLVRQRPAPGGGAAFADLRPWVLRVAFLFAAAMAALVLMGAPAHADDDAGATDRKSVV